MNKKVYLLLIVFCGLSPPSLQSMQTLSPGDECLKRKLNCLQSCQSIQNGDQRALCYSACVTACEGDKI